MKRSTELDELNQQVTQAILHAEHLPVDTVDARRAFEEVSRIEEAIVIHTNVDSLEGWASRCGAITAAMSAHDWRRAIRLADAFLLEVTDEPRRGELARLRLDAARDMVKASCAARDESIREWKAKGLI